jgi:chromosome partitioning protein
MQTIAIINEKGGTAKTTSAVNLAAALGEMGRKVLLVDLDGQAATSRWLGVEDDPRLADALLRGGGLEPIQEVLPGVALAPGSGKLDSVAHELRPTQGGQLRRVISAFDDQYDYALIDSPPSLANRLIGNAMLAADEAIVPVETSILALDGLRILLTMLEDVRAGFGHDVRLRGVLACRYDVRTRLSRLVLGELRRSLPGKVFTTVIRESVKLRECPAAGESILTYAPRSKATRDYRALARELVEGAHSVEPNAEAEQVDLTSFEGLDTEDVNAVTDFRKRAAEVLMERHRRHGHTKPAPKPQPSDEQDWDDGNDVEPPLPVADVFGEEDQARGDAPSFAEAIPSEMPSGMDSDQSSGDSPAPWGESDEDTSPAPSMDTDASVPLEGDADADVEPTFEEDQPSEPQEAAGDEVEQEYDELSEPMGTPGEQLEREDTGPAVPMEAVPDVVEQDAEPEPTEPHAQVDEQAEEPSDSVAVGEQELDEEGFPLPTDEEMAWTEAEHRERPWRRKKRVLQLCGTAAGVAMLVGVFLLGRGIVGQEAAQHASARDVSAEDRITVVPPETDEAHDEAEANDPTPVEPAVEPVEEPAVEPEPVELTEGDEGEPVAAMASVMPGEDEDAEPVADEQPATDEVDEPADGAAAEEEPATQPVVRYRECPPDMHLTCVLHGPNGYQALINDEMVGEGDVLSGARVLRIDERSVEMELEGERFTLGFEQGGNASADETVAEIVESDDGADGER